MGTITLPIPTREFKTKQGNTSSETWAWLTEPQATFTMTLSRNTERVVNCKLALSIAFDKAKRVIKEVIPAQAEEMELSQVGVAASPSQAALLGGVVVTERKITRLPKTIAMNPAYTIQQGSMLYC